MSESDAELANKDVSLSRHQPLSALITRCPACLSMTRTPDVQRGETSLGAIICAYFTHKGVTIISLGIIGTPVTRSELPGVCEAGGRGQTSVISIFIITIAPIRVLGFTAYSRSIISYLVQPCRSPFSGPHPHRSRLRWLPKMDSPRCLGARSSQTTRRHRGCSLAPPPCSLASFHHLLVGPWEKHQTLRRWVLCPSCCAFG